MSETDRMPVPHASPAGDAGLPAPLPASEASLDLSLGHLGTPHTERRWLACCDHCHLTMSDELYTAAERAAGPTADPRCPGCRKSFWSFHPAD